MTPLARVVQYLAMTSLHTIAQASATADQAAARALHLTSRARGRLDVLEAAVALRDARTALSALRELQALLEEVVDLTTRRAA